MYINLGVKSARSNDGICLISERHVVLDRVAFTFQRQGSDMPLDAAAESRDLSRLKGNLYSREVCAQRRTVVLTLRTCGRTFRCAIQLFLIRFVFRQATTQPRSLGAIVRTGT